ncbi:MAG: hypothetical protein M1340_09590 [Actinobacteria bacterium]|nr:hypothetical protein [Actinomycetota bacterium]
MSKVVDDMVKPSAKIKESGYENIHVTCPCCQQRNIVNRATDLDTAMPVSGMDLICEYCHEEFWISGDRASMAKYKWFLEELSFLKINKKYSLYILTLCQTLEIFFFEAIVNKKFDKNTYFRDESGSLKLEEYNAGRKDYVKKIQGHSFCKMRAAFFSEFKEEINSYMPRGIALKEDKRKECFDIIRTTNINVIRNKVPHKFAYLPSRADIEAFDDLIDAVVWVGMYLDIKDSIHYINKKITS